MSLFKPSPEARRDQFTTAHATGKTRRHLDVVERGDDYAGLCLVISKHWCLGPPPPPPDSAILNLESVVDAGIVVAVLDAAWVAEVDGELTHALLFAILLQPPREEL